MNIRNKSIICLPVLFFSVFCCFFRYMQRSTELLADGSLVEGAYLHRILILVPLCAIVACIIFLWKLTKHTSWKQFYNHKILVAVLFGAAGLLAIGNVLLWLSGRAPQSIYVAAAPGLPEFMSKLLPPLGLLAAVCIGIFAYNCYLNKKPSPLLYMCVSLYLTIRLIVCFQAWNTDPSIHDYCYALLANIFAMLAAFHLAGFSFDSGKRRMTLFWTIGAFLFNCITLADAIYDGDLAQLLVHSAFILITAINCSQLLFSEEN